MSTSWPHRTASGRFPGTARLPRSRLAGTLFEGCRASRSAECRRPAISSPLSGSRLRPPVGANLNEMHAADSDASRGLRRETVSAPLARLDDVALRKWAPEGRANESPPLRPSRHNAAPWRTRNQAGSLIGQRASTVNESGRHLSLSPAKPCTPADNDANDRRVSRVSASPSRTPLPHNLSAIRSTISSHREATARA
jgi:hypothetical protein